MEVIGAGFGRTGTMSLKVALERLGADPCYHMTEVFSNPDHVELWEAAARGESVDWEGLFRDYEAAVDWPACTFYAELMERYPEAKVILTVREPDRWYESARSTIYNVQSVASSPVFSLAALFVPRMRHLRRAALMAADLVWNQTFEGRFEDRKYAIEVFERWNEEVKRRVPAERLLVYEVKEGWEPLCAFLGAEVPAGEEFPHLNEGEAFRKTIRRLMVAATAALAGGATLTILALIYLAFRRAGAPRASNGREWGRRSAGRRPRPGPAGGVGPP